MRQLSELPEVDDCPACLALQSQAVLSVGMTVANLTRSLAFYRDVLGFEHESTDVLAGPAFERPTGVPGARARRARLRLGEELLELTEFMTPRGRPMPPDSRSNDVWFQHAAIIVRDMDAAYARLRRFGVQATSVAPQRLPDSNPTAGGIHAFYFRDPDGHILELLQFPPGKGQPKWHRPTDALLLGIDHTAIVVRSTDASLRFYQDRLGLEVVSTSQNHGPEQERLNNVSGTRLRITTLRAAEGPGIELLDYLAPRTGRPRPHDARPNDILHWQTTITVPGQRNGVLVADPDGHVVALTRSAG